jgi:hypothetical protein
LGNEPPDDGGGGPVCYNKIVGIQPVTINKYNAGDGTLKVDGDKLQRAAKEVVRRVIRENPLGSLRKVRSDTRNTEQIGTALIYGDIMEIRYQQYASKY